MRYPATFIDDLPILLKVFQLPGDALIYDPKAAISKNSYENFQLVRRMNIEVIARADKKMLIDCSGENIPDEISSAFEAVIAFNPKAVSCKKFHPEFFYYINSPDGAMRWVFPKTLKQPGFLSFYNNNFGLRATVFQHVVKLAFQTQTQHLICSGRFVVFSKKANNVHSLYAGEEHNFSIFTGSPGPHRKAVIALHKKNETTHFIKFPLTESAELLVKNEWDHLRCLNRFQFKNIEIPQAVLPEKGIKVSNIRPQQINALNTSLQNVHFSAVLELHERTAQTRLLFEIPFWNQSLDDIFFLVANTDSSAFSQSTKVRQLIGKLYEVSQQFDEETNLAIAYSHGDFTPWNMFLGKDRIHLFDWEMAALHRPMLYDLFHFIFQSQVVIKRNNFRKVAEAVDNMRKHPAVRKLIGKYDIDFDLHYQLYLLFNCSYFLKLYINQTVVPKQVLWLVDCWTEAFQDLSTQKILLAQSSRA